jgi:hypothetical protein
MKRTTEAPALRPWNTGFAWQEAEPPFEAMSPDEVAAFDRDGFVVVHDAFDAETIGRAASPGTRTPATPTSSPSST